MLGFGIKCGIKEVRRGICDGFLGGFRTPNLVRFGAIEDDWGRIWVRFGVRITVCHGPRVKS